MSDSFKNRNSHVKTFVIDYESDVDDYHYKGTFSCKKLSIRDMSSLGPRKCQLNGGQYYDHENPGAGVDSETDNFNSMVAHLELAIVDSPEWWDLGEIADVKLLTEVYKEVIDFESSFLGSRRGKKKAAKKSAKRSEKDSGAQA